ncbi:MAG: RNA 2'-phosphotransferase [Chthonomonadales bacterium]
MDASTRSALGRLLGRWLRHRPDEATLELSPDGWAMLPDVRSALERRGYILSDADLEEIVRNDPKDRFELESGRRIRARYGHTVSVEAGMHPGMPPAQLFCGVDARRLPGVLQVGLKPAKRAYLHLSTTRKAAVEAASRRGRVPTVLAVAAHAAWAAGVRFYPRGRAVWLSDPVPPEFLTVIEDAGGEGEDGTRANPGRPRRRRPHGGFLKRHGHRE